LADNPSGAIGEDKHSQAQTTSATAAAPSAGQVAGNEAKNQPADVITDKQPTHDVVEATQATDKAAPDASGDKSTSVSNEVDTAPTPEPTPAKAATPSKAVPELELGEDPASRPPSTDSSIPPPLPEKDTAVINKPTPVSDETSASPSQSTEPAPTKVEDKAEEPEAPETENADSSKHDAVEEGLKPQSGVDGNIGAVGEGSATQDGDGKVDGTAKLTVRTARVRELSSASIMSASSSTPGTPDEEVVSSAVDEKESGVPGQAGTSNKNKTKKEKEKEREKERKKRQQQRKKKGEKNSPHTPSGETVHNADDSTIQDRNPPVVASTPPVHIPSGDGDVELVERVAGSEEDAPVMVNKVHSSGEDSGVKVEMPQDAAEKTANGDSGTDDEWANW
jgi:hypothetical protein